MHQCQPDDTLRFTNTLASTVMDSASASST